MFFTSEGVQMIEVACMTKARGDVQRLGVLSPDLREGADSNGKGDLELASTFE
jgi:hypothetical protein